MARNQDWLSKVESRWALAQQFGALPVIGAAIGGGLTAATEFMNAWAPFSYFAGACFGALAFQGWGLLREWQRERGAKRDRIESLAPPKGYVNPAQDRFVKERIYLPDLLLPGDYVLKNREFIDCQIIGPANLFMKASHPGAGGYEHCGFYSCDGVFAKEGVPAHNVVLLEDCRFKRCTFLRFTLVFSDKDETEIRTQLSGLSFLN